MIDSLGDEQRKTIVRECVIMVTPDDANSEAALHAAVDHAMTFYDAEMAATAQEVEPKTPAQVEHRAHQMLKRLLEHRKDWLVEHNAWRAA